MKAFNIIIVAAAVIVYSAQKLIKKPVIHSFLIPTLSPLQEEEECS